MSALILPKHWRFNAPLLMGHLKKGSGGHLLHTASGHLVNACGTEPPEFCCVAGHPVTVPTSVTIPTLSGCCANATGTYILSEIMSDPCRYGGSRTISYTPCVDPVCSDAVSIYYLDTISVVVQLTTSTIDIVVTLQYVRYFNPPCTVSTLPTQTWEFQGDCTTGVVPWYTGDEYPPTGGSPPTCYPASVTLA